MKKTVFVFLIVCLLFAFAQAEPVTTNVNQKVYDVVLHLADADQYAQLKELYLTVTDRDGADFYLMASAAEIEYLQKLGYELEVLGRNDLIDAAGYRSYADSITELQNIASTYPQLTALSEVADSWDGRKVVVLKISDNAADSEVEPALLYDFTIHGDEAIANELAFEFIYHLLQNYGSDQAITTLIDENEFFIVPFVNPDGLTTRRGNSHGVDMNRNYPFFWEGFGQWSPEPETVGMMNLCLQESFLFSISYHSGAELVNYNWDGIYTLSPENELELYMSNLYASHGTYSVTNGAAWYIADGTSEDWYHGAIGTISVIVEISNNKMPPASAFQHYFDMNIPAMIDWAQQADQAMRGVVTSAVSGDPLEAILIADGRLPVVSDPLLGDYYRLLPPGNQTLHVWANGYGWTDVNATIPETGHLTKDIVLQPTRDSILAAVRCVLNLRDDLNDNPPNVTLPVSALGGHDGVAFSTGVGGYAAFDMGANTPVVDQPGAELTVYENGNDESYSVLVANEWTGPWQSLGQGTGTTDFDIATSSLAEIRYVLIRDDGDGANNEATPGVDIDAIEALPFCDAPVANFTGNPTSGTAPLSVEFTSQVQFTPGCLSEVAWDFGDGATSSEANPTHVYQESGVYTVSLTAGGPGGEDEKVREDYITVSSGADDDVTDDDVTDDDAADDDVTDDDAADDDDDDDDSGCGC